jgi:hypothetical protein
MVNVNSETHFTVSVGDRLYQNGNYLNSRRNGSDVEPNEKGRALVSGFPCFISSIRGSPSRERSRSQGRAREQREAVPLAGREGGPSDASRPRSCAPAKITA